MKSLVTTIALSFVTATLLGAQEAKAPQKRSPELQVLDRFLGTWRNVATVNPGSDQAHTTTSTVTRTWTREGTGNFMKEHSVSEEGEEEAHIVYTYDPAGKIYRVTYLSRNSALIIKGTWDEEKRTMKWEGLDLEGNVATGTHRFITRDNAEWSWVSKNEDGETVFQCSAKATRIK